MVDPNPRIPSSDDIRRLFEQLPDVDRRRRAPTPLPTPAAPRAPNGQPQEVPHG